MKSIGLYHIHKRTRRAKGLEPYPSRNPWIRLLDQVAICAGIIGPLMTVPQIWQIFYSHDAAGVSIFSWAAFACLDIPFILYAVVHRSKLFFVTYVLWFIVNSAVVIGTIMYR